MADDKVTVESLTKEQSEIDRIIDLLLEFSPSSLVWGYLLAIMLISLAAIIFVKMAHSFINTKRNVSKKGKAAFLKYYGEEENPSFSSVLQKSTLWVIGSLLTQAPPWNPQGVADRVMTSVWLIFCLIIGTLYQSNLKAMLILPKANVPFDNIEGVIKSGRTVHVNEGSFIYSVIMEASPDSVFGRLRKQIVISSNTYEATEKTFKGEYIRFSSHSTHRHYMHVDYSQTGECSLFATHKNAMFRSVSVALAFPPNSPLISPVNKILVNLREFGILDYLYERQVPNASECLKPISATLTSQSKRPLGMKDLYGVFSIYLAGLVFGLLTFLLEMLSTKVEDVEDKY